MNLNQYEIKYLSEKMAAKLHEEWRKGYIAEHGDVPRIKTTKDQAWIEIHGTDQIDINRPYSELSSDWKRENLEAASVAVGLVCEKQTETGSIELSDKEIEELSSIVHDEWLKRNEWVYDKEYGNPDLAKPYAELSEVEKQKDRNHILAACDIVKEYEVKIEIDPEFRTSSGIGIGAILSDAFAKKEVSKEMHDKVFANIMEKLGLSKAETSVEEHLDSIDMDEEISMDQYFVSDENFANDDLINGDIDAVDRFDDSNEELEYDSSKTEEVHIGNSDDIENR